MTKAIRVGGACGFYGDSSVAPGQLLAAGIDYMVLDYLAEATMSVLGAMRRKRDTLGYAMDFTEWVWKDHVRALKDKGVRIVTNAGGVNPHGCAARMRDIAAKAGVEMKIAVVDGDDLTGRLDAIADDREMFTGTPFPPRDAIVTANAYLGATPIARALALGADVVVTGRVVDSALTLGPLMHEFGWAIDDYDKLSAGSLAGHILECGAQGSGALFTDWQDVPDWAHIGYPIAECAADGSFIVTKPEGTGGLVTTAVVAEQVLYEDRRSAGLYAPRCRVRFHPDEARTAGRASRARLGRDRLRADGRLQGVDHLAGRRALHRLHADRRSRRRRQGPTAGRSGTDPGRGDVART